MSVELESAKRLTALKNKIDTKTGTPSNTLSESVDNVIAGYGQGGLGGDSYYDVFWDAYQNYGERGIYEYAFRGVYSGSEVTPCWSKESLVPKYNIRPTSASGMFQIFRRWKDDEGNDYLVDLEAHLNECDISLDFSMCKDFSYMCAQAYIEVFPTVDASSASVLTRSFEGYQGTIIRKLIVHRGITTYNNTFTNATNLTDIDVEGEIGADISFASCKKLSAKSRQSIVNTLVDLTGGTSQTLTVPSTLFDVFLEEHGETITAKNWKLK